MQRRLTNPDANPHVLHRMRIRTSGEERMGAGEGGSHGLETRDIPGGGFTIPEKWQDLFRQLLALRDRLIADRTHMLDEVKEAQPSSGLNSTDTAYEESERERLVSLIAMEDAGFAEIEAAIERIEKGTYGICEMSGEPIPMERLRVIPWTRFTADAQMKREAEAADAARRTRHGKR